MPTNHVEYQSQNHQNGELFTLIPSTALRDADIDSGPQNNISARGVLIIVKLSDEAGTAGFTPRILIKDEAGNDIIYWSAGAELTANGTAVYLLTPVDGGGAGSGVTAHAALQIPRNWIFQLDYTTGTPATDSFTVAAYAMYLL